MSIFVDFLFKMAMGTLMIFIICGALYILMWKLAAMLAALVVILPFAALIYFYVRRQVRQLAHNEAHTKKRRK